MILRCIDTKFGQNATSDFRKLQVYTKKSIPDYPRLYMSTLRMIVQTEDVICCLVAVIQLEFRNINLYSKTSEVNRGVGRNLTGKKQKLFLQLNFPYTDATDLLHHCTPPKST